MTWAILQITNGYGHTKENEKLTSFRHWGGGPPENPTCCILFSFYFICILYIFFYKNEKDSISNFLFLFIIYVKVGAGPLDKQVATPRPLELKCVRQIDAGIKHTAAVNGKDEKKNGGGNGKRVRGWDNNNNVASLWLTSRLG
jgi:hypothetical protein